MKFVRLYKVSYQKKELIVNMGWYEGENWRWTLSWKRRLELEEKHDESYFQAFYNSTTQGGIRVTKLIGATAVATRLKVWSVRL